MKPKFSDLWNNHPSVKDSDNYPCKKKNGDPKYANQCAIRMGIALARSGVQLTGVTKCKIHAKTEGHILGAQQLANALMGRKAMFGTVQIRKQAAGILASDYHGKTGIVFFRDFWTPDGATRPTGDHIDVWDGTNQAHGADEYFARAKEVWFWEIP